MPHAPIQWMMLLGIIWLLAAEHARRYIMEAIQYFRPCSSTALKEQLFHQQVMMFVPVSYSHKVMDPVRNHVCGLLGRQSWNNASTAPVTQEHSCKSFPLIMDWETLAR